MIISTQNPPGLLKNVYASILFSSPEGPCCVEFLFSLYFTNLEDLLET